MWLKTIILVTLTTISIAGAGKKHHGDDSHVGYKFGYAVHDPHTHDEKSHHEERHGKHVTGYYKLKQPDGTTRVVHYKAGPHTGFEAVVEILGHPHHKDHHGHHNDHGHGHKGHHGHHHHDHGHKGHEDHGKKDHGHGYEVHEDHQGYTGAKHNDYQEEEDDDDY